MDGRLTGSYPETVFWEVGAESPAKMPCQLRCRDANWPTCVTSRAGRSFRVTLCETAILATRIKQVAYRCGLDTSRAVEVSNLKGDPPLLKEHTVGVDET